MLFLLFHRDRRTSAASLTGACPVELLRQGHPEGDSTGVAKNLHECPGKLIEKVIILWASPKTLVIALPAAPINFHVSILYPCKSA